METISKKMSDIDINDEFFDHLKTIDKHFVSWFESHRKGYCYVSQDSNKKYLAFMSISLIPQAKTIQIDFLETTELGRYLIPKYIERAVNIGKVNGYNTITIELPTKNRYLINTLINNHEFVKETTEKGYTYLTKTID